MKKFQLPINVQNEIITHLYDALPLCIILANENLKGWFYNHFISLYLESTRHTLGYRHHDIRYAENGIYIDYCSYKEVLTFNPVNAENIYLHNEIISFLKHNLNNRNYVILFLDYYELPQTRYYHNQHLDHEILIYGYDDEEQCLNCILYNQIGKFTNINIHYKDIKKAFCNLYHNLSEHDIDLWFYLKFVYLIKPLPFQFEFDLYNFIGDIQNYYNGNIDVYKQMNLHLLKRNHTITLNINGHDTLLTEKWQYHFGVNIFDELCEILENNRLRYGCEILNFLEYHIIYEHSIQIAKRLQYVYKNMIEDHEFSSEIQKFGQIIKYAEYLRWLVLKYNQLYIRKIINGSNAKQYIDKIKELLKRIGREEKEILSNIYHILCQI